jgi:hypothetical protein
MVSSLALEVKFPAHELWEHSQSQQLTLTHTYYLLTVCKGAGLGEMQGIEDKVNAENAPGLMEKIHWQFRGQDCQLKCE